MLLGCRKKVLAKERHLLDSGILKERMFYDIVNYVYIREKQIERKPTDPAVLKIPSVRK